MVSFVSRIGRKYGREEAEWVEWIFDQLQLPIPQTRCYTSNAHEGFLVFLNDYGCILKFDRRSQFRGQTSPFICQPLAQIVTPWHVMEILPGLRTPVAPEDAEFVQEQLVATGYKFTDPHNDNCGYLPSTDERFPQGFPVAIDRMAVKLDLVSSFSNDDLAPDLKPYADLQERLYGPLKAKFAEAWPHQNQRSDPQKMNEFWEMCRANTLRPKKHPLPPISELLCSNWEGKPKPVEFTTLRTVANHYEELCNAKGANLPVRSRPSSLRGLS